MTETLANLRKTTGTNVNVEEVAQGNSIINGGFTVWQRGTSFGPLASSTVHYTADRWCAYRGGAAGNIVVNRVTGSNNSQYAARVQRNTGDTDTTTISFAQSVRTIDSYRYRGKEITIRFMARKGVNFSAASDTLQVVVATGTGTDENIVTGMTGQTLDINTSVTLTDSWQLFEVTSAAAAGTSITQIACNFNLIPTGTAGAADYFEIDEVSILARGVNDTAFAYRDYLDELRACQPFYTKLSYEDVINQRVAAGYIKTTTTADFYVQLPFKLIGVPTITSTAGNTFDITHRATSSNLTSIAFGALSSLSFQIEGTVASGLTTGDGALLRRDGTDTCNFELDAEL